MAGEPEKKDASERPTEAPAEEKKEKEGKDGEKKKKDEKDENRMSEEDQQIKEQVEELVAKITAEETSDADFQDAVGQVAGLLTSTTGTVTTVPRPLKFIKAHYEKLKEVYAKRPYPLFADILSLLAMIGASGDDSVEALEFKLKGNIKDFAQWGHEHVRHIAGELVTLVKKRREAGEDDSDLLSLASEIVKFNFQHNSEYQAIDLAWSVQRIDEVIPFATKENHDRVVDYLTSLAEVEGDAEKRKLLEVGYNILMQVELYPHALRQAMIMKDLARVKQTWDKVDPEDRLTKTQMAFMLGRMRMFIRAAPSSGMDVDEEDEEDDDDDYVRIIRNGRLSELFRFVATDLNSLDPKTVEDIYKTNVTDQRTSTSISSSTQNLANSFVNGFANACFGKDKLLTENGTEWVYKNKEHRMISAVASYGLIHLWDPEVGMIDLDKFMYADDVNIKAGALLGSGIVNCGVYSSNHPAEAVLVDNLENQPREVRLGAIIGLGLAYAGTQRQTIREALLPFAADSDAPFEVCAFAALSLGLVFIGTCEENITETVMAALMERAAKEAKNPLLPLLSMALGLLYLGQVEQLELALEALTALTAVDETAGIGRICEFTVKMCAHAGSGNVDIVREFFKACVEKIEDEEKGRHQMLAVIGIAMVAMGESLGADMCRRHFEHLLMYGEPSMRRAVPLALAMVSVSNPQIIVTDTLGKLTHDADELTSMNAVLALGIVAAGTNNARVANMLKSLANYYAKEANHLFLVRVAQGLLCLGKGLLTLNPFHSDRRLIDPTAVGGLFIVLLSCLDIKGLILSQYHYMLYYLTPALSPRFLVTVNEEVNTTVVSVRVGQAVDTVAVPGRPKRITGFQTHDTPVLMSWGDRAELATDKYKTNAAVLEGVVVVSVNPESEDKAKEDAKSKK